jgi:hypothetical protein
MRGGMLWFFTFVANTVNQQQLLISASADMLWLKRGGVLANDGRHDVFPSLVVETGSSGLAL